MEMADEGCNPGLGEERAKYIIEQLINAFSYCHENGIIHSDIKLENILIDRNINIKIIDFDFAKYKNINKL